MSAMNFATGYEKIIFFLPQLTWTYIHFQSRIYICIYKLLHEYVCVIECLHIALLVSEYPGPYIITLCSLKALNLIDWEHCYRQYHPTVECDFRPQLVLRGWEIKTQIKMKVTGAILKCFIIKEYLLLSECSWKCSKQHKYIHHIGEKNHILI